MNPNNAPQTVAVPPRAFQDIGPRLPNPPGSGFGKGGMLLQFLGQRISRRETGKPKRDTLALVLPNIRCDNR